MKLVAALLTPALLVGAGATLDGSRIHYESYGKGREALVFIHGWTCDLTFWRTQAPVYESRRSLLIDLPGHGRSDKPKLRYTPQHFVRAVDAVLRDAGVDKAVLIGHSMGSTVSLTFLKEHPDKVAGIVLVDGFIAEPSADMAKRREQAQARAKMWNSPDYKARATEFINGMFIPATPAALRGDILSRMLATPQHVLASAMEEMMTMESWTPAYSGPVMVIMRKRPSLDGFDAKLKAMFPRVRYEAWDDVGHFLMMEQPARFNKALREFLEHPPTSSR